MRPQRDLLIQNRYQLHTRIGSGGMAEVWSATDQLLDRPVAVKFLHDRFAKDPRFLERFQREASAAAVLQHPNVVSVYDRGQFEGAHFIVMEYVEGASLKDLIDRGLGVAEAVEITRQILAGAGFAHARGIVHRDLKPQNVLVDAEGRARVADFGIARAGASDVTEAGSVLGTAQYLSPEQAQGQDVTAASDLYSVGIILYEALTGRVPFDAETPVAVVMKHVTETPPPPSRLNPQVSPALDAVVMKALEKDPAARYSSAREFSDALEAAWRDPGDTGATRVIAPIPVPIAVAAPPRHYDPEEAAAAERAAALAEDPDEGSKWGRGWRLALIVFLVLLALGALAWALFGGSKAQVEVPDVVGMTADDGRGELENLDFEVDQRSRASCKPVGEIVAQSPRGGEDADEGSTVITRVSSGQQGELPDVAGSQADAAVEELNDLELELDVTTRKRFNDEVEEGEVIGTQPAAGSSVECGAPVVVLVSRGEDLVDVPDVVGSDVNAATATLDSAGLVTIVVETNADEPEGQVLSQDPTGGDSVPRDSEVTLTVSNGLGTVVVPNMVGQPEDTAVETLEQRGATNVNVVYEDTDDQMQDGRVLDQAPGADTRIRSGDQVTLFVGRYVEPEDPGGISSTARGLLRSILDLVS